MTFIPAIVALVLAEVPASGVAIPMTPDPEATRALHALFDEQWESWMKDSPTWASELGDHRYDDRWSDDSAAAQESRSRRDEALLARLRALDPLKLSSEDRLNASLFELKVANEVEERRFRTYLMPLSHMEGIQTLDNVSENLRFETSLDFDNWLARLRAVATSVDVTTELLREGLKTGLTQPRVIMQRVPDQIAHQIVDDPTKSPFYDPFEKMPDSVPVKDQERLRAAATEVIRSQIVPAYKRLETYFTETYLPGCRDAVGCSTLPGGQELYAFRARHHTTTTLNPREIHDIGLREVARIHAEMETVMRRTGFKGEFAEFLQFLRTDPRFYAKTPEELLMRYRDVSKRIDPEICRIVHVQPRMPYGVRPIPDEIAPDTTTAYYNAPAADGSRAGTYWVNLYKPETRPIWEMMALSLHEAVPGHHLQIALAQELGELPRFRRHLGYTAYIEGWGLYAEHLGEELGLYDDPYSKFGQLTYEMWRAVRLVVDTGMHSFGWSRERAIEYFKSNAPKTEQDIVNEIDRYIAWPGQALAYKVGELKIKELRARAEVALGQRFDVRAFHDLVLGSGSVPLTVLEQQVDAWIAQEKG